ncbi:hypothetical protein HELRODRAFT_68574 [Helobdella robusta]|uniref:Paired domain-containing protein n=1 Tax=Helobdella robusta TaxID=6412 RepID=T1FZG9_HELRO|nr:hypothetical protein HELRODRAFT_68574 [Helobdella robusta]ESN96783.1 hypothetical protein HELRODRAFT_68574 [Helobdella robusta]
MGRGKKLNRDQTIQILTLRFKNYSLGKISKSLNVFKIVFLNFCKNPLTSGTKKSTGRPQKLTKRRKALIIKKVFESTSSSVELINDLQLNCSISNVKRCLKKCNY